ncbi:hypothetical protein FHS43_006827 [Streptosporangium becharense]|uniref:Uncharacterized protein n=1 Tax=Streptosporangium becharense TaxID=1816182 RepID=A0A7W9II61_9ACTN|nr:hypothetical protein [Streptosporangium becharense]MBB2915506.1 hypothetical protein [Streptosporangium becharense]MBB5821011.1 hypothetical protein [Streptosporangium becharense]
MAGNLVGTPRDPGRAAGNLVGTPRGRAARNLVGTPRDVNRFPGTPPGGRPLKPARLSG